MAPRTLATIAAGNQEKHLAGFGPKVEGFDQVPLGDLDAARAAIGPQTAAILIEPIQGEGGVRHAGWSFLRALRRLVDQQHGRRHRAKRNPRRSALSLGVQRQVHAAADHRDEARAGRHLGVVAFERDGTELVGGATVGTGHGDLSGASVARVWYEFDVVVTPSPAGPTGWCG